MTAMAISAWLAEHNDDNIDINISFGNSDSGGSDYVCLKMKFKRIDSLDLTIMIFNDIPITVRKYINIGDLTDTTLRNSLNELYKHGKYKCEITKKMIRMRE